jgi:hypothetical protein
VREAKGEQWCRLIDHLKKGDMAREAGRLLDSTGWLPEPLRLVEVDATGHDTDGEPEGLPEFLVTAALPISMTNSHISSLPNDRSLRGGFGRPASHVNRGHRPWRGRGGPGRV